MAKRKYTYIDLFSGSGGFSLGFDNANFENIFSVEFNHGICETYKHNFPSHTLLECDIADLTETEIKKIIGKRKVDVIIGGTAGITEMLMQSHMGFIHLLPALPDA